MKPPSIAYTVCMNGLRPESAWAALATVAFQTIRPLIVIVRDGGSVPFTSQVEFRFVLDMLQEKGVTVYYTREQHEGLEQSRNSLVRLAERQAPRVAAFIDDDSLWEPDVAEKCLTALAETNRPWVIASSYTPNREGGPLDMPWQEDANPRFSWAAPGEERYEPANDAGTYALFFHLHRWRQEWLRDYPTGIMGGDLVATEMMGEGVIVRDAVSWELKSPRDRRIATTASKSDDLFARQWVARLRA